MRNRALVVVCVWQLTGRDGVSRTDGDRRGAPGAAATAEPEAATKKTAAYASVLRGRVLDPTGHAVHKAEVSRLEPKPVDVVFTDEEGRYELPLLGPGRHLIEAAFGVDLAPRRVEIVAPEEGVRKPDSPCSTSAAEYSRYGPGVNSSQLAPRTE